MITLPDISLVNTREFRRAALHYHKYGVYTNAVKDTVDWYEFWDQEIERIKHGYSVGGVHITGEHYFYLNYCRMSKIDKSSIKEGGQAVKVESFPDFWDGDYHYFHSVDRARKEGKHLVVLKARRKGYSYKLSSQMARVYFGLSLAERNSKCYAMASDKAFLIEDGILNKTWSNIDFIDKNTAWTQGRLKDTEMHRKCGYIQNIAGTNVELGKQNEIIGVTLKDNPDKARGKAGYLGIFEEGGKFPGLLKAWEVCKSSYEDGAFTVGTMIAFGTGGSKEGDFEDLQKLFYNPDAYGALAFENVWDANARGTKCGFFVPAYQNFQGYIDEDGNSDNEGAIEYFTNQRELRKQAAGGEAYQQYICEFPFDPSEAMLVVRRNVFPVAELKEQLAYVKSHKLYNSFPCGYFFRDREGEVKFKITDQKPVGYPPKEGEDQTGCITLLEAPYKDAYQNVPDNLYVIGHDPYAHDGKGGRGRSLGGAYVGKMPNAHTPTYNESIVCGYVGRPETQDAYNEQLFMMAEYYNAKIGFENDRGEVIPFAKRKKLLKYLAAEFQMLDNRELQSRNVRRSYGMHMTPKRKEQGEFYIRDWLLTEIGKDVEGKPQYIYQTIVFQDLLQELIDFYIDGNFDRVMALMVLQYHMNELITRRKHVQIKDQELKEGFFQRSLFR